MKSSIPMAFVLIAAVLALTSCKEKSKAPQPASSEKESSIAEIDRLAQLARSQANRIQTLLRRGWCRKLPHIDELQARSTTLQDFVRHAYQAPKQGEEELRRLVEFGRKKVEGGDQTLGRLLEAIERLTPRADEILNLSQSLREGFSRAGIPNNHDFPLRFRYTRFNDMRSEWMGDMRLAIEDFLLNGNETRLKVIDKNLGTLAEGGRKLLSELKLRLRRVDRVDRRARSIAELKSLAKSIAERAKTQPQDLSPKLREALSGLSAAIAKTEANAAQALAGWPQLRERILAQKEEGTAKTEAIAHTLDGLLNKMRARLTPLATALKLEVPGTH